MSIDQRKEFEKWVNTEFYGDMESIEDDWCEEKRTYKTFTHHAMWCVWRNFAKLNNPTSVPTTPSTKK